MNLQYLLIKYKKNLLNYFKYGYKIIKKLINDERTTDIYFKNHIKIMGGKLSRDVIEQRIRSKLFEYLKFNLKNIVQYEFIF